MDNQEAIEWFRTKYAKVICDDCETPVGMAISALQAQDGTDTNVGGMISRQKAIDAVCSVCGVDCDKSEFVYNGKQEDQVILCPEHYALTQLPSASPELSTEIQEILDYLDTTLHPIVSPDNWDVYAELHDMVSRLPSAQSERKAGRWLIRDGISDAQCSECKMYFKDVYDMDNSDAFCRHCGAKMKGLKVIKHG